MASSPRIRAGLGWGLPLVVGLVHVALIAPHYFVGSFDDDASYIMTAQAMASGAGLGSHVASGAPVVGLYPPGYSALLVPLMLLWPHTFVPLRVFSAVCVAALFPLLWVYLGRKGISRIARSITLLLLALTPVLATYGSMVMAEAPFLVLFMAVLLLVDRWDRQERAWTAAGVGVVVASAAVVWVKSAGIGAILGLVLYLVGRRDTRAEIKIRRAALVTAGVGLSLVPLLIARMATDTPVLGSRYASELGGYYSGGLLSRLLHVAPASALHLVGIAIPDTIAPYRSPLPANPFLMNIVWQAFAIQMIVVMAVGALWWWRRNHDAAVAVVLVYLLETIFWPEVNERRVILVIPILVSWYVLGGVAIIDFARRRRAAGRGRSPRATIFAAGGVAGLTVAMLLPQLPRDYLFALGQDTSHFGGSRYASLLSHLGPPSAVLETDYLNSSALFTGHRTGWSAFAPSGGAHCSFAGISQDAAAYMLLADVNQTDVLDSPCLLQLASTSPWAVELLHTSRDNAIVFELIGPGTGHPDLIDLTRTATETVSRDGDHTILKWNWSTLRPVDQVSVGQVNLSGARRVSSELELLTAAGTWKVVASSRSAVGDGAGDAPYLLAANLGGEQASAVRVVVNGTSPAGIADVEDVAALGG